MRKIHLVFVMILVIFSASCRKNEVTVVPASATPLLTLHFTYNWIPVNENAVVFLSDKNGNLLLDTVCTGNNTYVLDVKKGIARPDTFMMTVARPWKLLFYSEKIEITSYAEMIASEMTLSGNYSDSVGTTHLKFINYPDSGKNLNVLYGVTGYGYAPSFYTKMDMKLLVSPDHFFIRILANGSPGRYQWIDTVESGKSYTIDLANMNVADSQHVTLPISAGWVESYVWGYYGDGNNYLQGMPVDFYYKLSPDSNISSLICHYPGKLFKSYFTHIQMQEKINKSPFRFYSVWGEIPKEAKKINADLITQQGNSTGMSYQASGSYNVVAGAWLTFGNTFSWIIYTPGDKHQISLPQLPLSFKVKYPDFHSDSLKYTFLTFYDYTGFKNYWDILKTGTGPEILYYQKPVEMTSATYYLKDPELLKPYRSSLMQRAMNTNPSSIN